MASGLGKISCDACGKSYAWKPQFAGRTLKCVCGAAIKAPVAPPEEAAPPPDLSSADEFEQAFSGGNQQVEAPAPRSVSTGLAGAIAAAGAPKARKYEVDYTDGNIYSTISKLKLAMSLVALIISIVAFVAYKAATAHKKRQDSQIVVVRSGQRRVYEVSEDGNRIKDVTDLADNTKTRITTLAPATRPSGANGTSPVAPPVLTPQQKAIMARVAKEDKEIASIIKDEELMEARAWCAPDQNFHAGKRLQMPTIVGWANQFYDAGAKTVYMRAGKQGRFELAEEWVVEMPDDPEKRFQVLKTLSQLHHDVPLIDIGHKYLMFPVDRG